LTAAGKGDLAEAVIRHQYDLIFVTASVRLLANTFVVFCSIQICWRIPVPVGGKFALGILMAVLVSMVFSVSIPTALAQHLAEASIGMNARLLLGLRAAMAPLTATMHWTEKLVIRMAGIKDEDLSEEIERDILSVVQEGEKEGVVDTQERRMIESVIEFRDTDVGQTMTARPKITGIEVTATLDEVRRVIDASGHSRLPVYDGTLDHIVGILYARDLLKHLGLPADQFEVRSVMRGAIFVPETKPLRDLLREFRVQKVHIAIVLDEYGGTSGLVTIEDILEELVGDISDEHEPSGSANFRKINDTTVEVDGRMFLDELQARFPIALPEELDVDTIGGYVSTALGRIPQRGTVLEQGGVRYTVLDAEPQVVKRLRLERLTPAGIEDVRAKSRATG
jgi:putative hemolysin